MRPPVSPQDLTRNDVFAMAALGLLATALGVLQLGAESVWLDESASVAIASREPAALWTHVTRVELSGSAYYLLLHGWIGLFGQTETAIRSLSVIFVVATVPFVYMTGRMLFDRWVAVGATLILVTSAFIVSFAQEARGYALALFLTSLATFLFVRGLSRSTWASWLLYVVVAALSPYAHFYSGLVLAAHAVSLLFIDRRSVRWRPILTSFGLIAVLTIPVVRFALFVENAACRTAWVPPMSVRRVGVVLWELVGANQWLLVALGLAVLAALAAVLLQRRDQASRWPVLLALLLVALPIALSIAISIFRPLLVTRYLIMAVPGLAYLAAYGLASLRPRPAGLVALIAVVALSGWGLATYYLEPRKPDFRNVTQVVADVAGSADAAILYQRFGEPGHLLTYYLDQFELPGSAPVVVDLPDPTDYMTGGSATDCPTTPNDAYRAAVEETVADLYSSHDRVVLVNGQAPDDPFLPVLVGALESRYSETERFLWEGSRWHNPIELHVYEARDATAGPGND